jgi:HD-like signal output (HDOD) protein
VKPDIERRLRQAVDELSPLPVLQGTVAEVRTLAEDPEATTDAVVRAIERDEAFAANLLRFANSAAAARPIRARDDPSGRDADRLRCDRARRA